MKKVAITGGYSSGKSSVGRLLQERGAYYVSADEIVHQLLSPKTKIGKEILKLLGEEIVLDDQFDKKAIAKKVFENKEKLSELEQILHPAVIEEIEKQYKKINSANEHPFFVAEIPLLYEIEKAHLFDSVVAVHADPTIAKKRLNTPEDFEQRMIHQMPSEKKCALADYTITNNGDLADLEYQVENLFQQLTS